MVISFNPKFNIGDVVSLKIDSERTFIVVSYHIYVVDERGDVLSCTFGCSDNSGEVKFFRPFELELFSEVAKEK